MKKYIRTLCVLTILINIIVFCNNSDQTMWVTGYYPVWASGTMNPENINYDGLTHIVHFSANPVQTSPYLDVLVTASDSLIMEDNGSQKGIVNRLITSAHSHGTKVVLSLGGVYGTGASNMDYVASDSVRADIFAVASVAYAKRRGYDGIELDWEQPGNATICGRMIRLMHRELIKWSTPGLLVIAGAPADKFHNYDAIYNIPEIAKYVDQFNQMMYDHDGTSSWFGGTYANGFNAPLYPPRSRKWGSGTNGSDTVWVGYNYDDRWCLSEFLATRNPNLLSRSKIGVGVPFYGKRMIGTSTPDEAHTYPQYITYENAQSAIAKGLVYHWDSETHTPWLGGSVSSSPNWLFTTGNTYYVTYEDTTSIADKVKWAQSKGYGGIMIYNLVDGWVSSGTVKDPLLRAVVNTIRGTTMSTADTTVPSVAISSPVEGDSVSGSVTITANASDNVGVTRVDFVINGVTSSTDNVSPYSYVWSTTDLIGSRTLTAIVYDAAGNKTTSSSVLVYIKEESTSVELTAPTLLLPSDGAAVDSATLSLSWQSVSNAVNYKVEVATDSLFKKSVLLDSTVTLMSRKVSGLTGNDTYYWRVSAKASEESSSPSKTRKFNINVTSSCLTLNKTTVSFGKVAVSLSKVDSLLLTNTTSETLTVTTIQSLIPQFTVRMVSASIVPGGSQKLYITFSPTVRTNYSSKVLITFGVNSLVDTITVSGTGARPPHNVRYPGTIAVSTVAIGTSVQENFYIYNDGDINLVVNSIRSTNPDFVVSPGSVTVVPSDSVKVTITLSPSNVNSTSGYLIFMDNSEKAIDSMLISISAVTGTVETPLNPSEFVLSQNFPNPFNPTTEIQYSLPVAGRVVVQIFNALGQQIATLLDAYQDAGMQSIRWNATDQFGNVAASGMYFYKVDVTESAGNKILFSAVKKMLFIK